MKTILHKDMDNKLDVDLAKLLSAKQPLFDFTIDDLEHVTNRSSVSTNLANEIQLKFSRFCKNYLEIDCEKSSGEEVYKKLMELIWNQNDLVLEKYLGLRRDASLDEIISACVNFVEKMELSKSVFRLKKSKAREMIKKSPPKNILKLLNYKNVDELLKNERLDEVYGALRFAEGDVWLDEFNKQYKNLTPDDFTLGKIELIKMPLKWAPLTKSFIEKKKHNVTHLKELGIVMVLETEDESLRHGLVLKALPLIVHYFYEVHLYSVFFKLKSKTLSNKSFGKILADTILADPKLNINFGGEHIHWRVIQRYFGKLDDIKKHPEIFEPHLQPEDLHWDKAEVMLGKHIPELMIWEDLDYVGILKDDLPLSLNLMDLTLSFANKNRYREHLFYHFRESLWNEIFARYMSQEVLEEELLAKLNNSLIRPERIKFNK
ncbi:MAG: hypothetical protein H6799_00195 [Candidatus Nomurabacteria bacterium]|nr:MAG: hypothetical protein H6799_00195 [Candidatus Nomurabacteria bacterium]